MSCTSVSHVVGALDEKHDVVDALMAGFPAGTLSGAPKVRAMEIIDALEKEKRGPYGGCVGYFSADGEMDSCIVLRTALVKDGMIHVQAGAGIVADSDPEAEQLECEYKARALFKAAEEAVRFARAASAATAVPEPRLAGEARRGKEHTAAAHFDGDVLPRASARALLPTAMGCGCMCWRPASRRRAVPASLLLHGFPELAYSWRKLMLPLAAAGFYVVAPDQRGYGRTTGWDGGYDGDLRPFRVINLVRDTLGLVSALGHRSVAAVIGHDFGSPVAAWCALLRPDMFRSVVLMSAPFAGPPALPTAGGGEPPPAATDIHAALAALEPPRKHYHWYYSTREPTPTCATVRRASTPSCAPTTTTRAPTGRATTVPACGLERRGARQAADLLRHAAGAGHGRDGGAAHAPAGRDRRLPLADRGRARRLQRRVRAHRLPGRAQLVSLPHDGRFEAEQQVFAGRTHRRARRCFIAGKSDWGVYQLPGALEQMQTSACTRMRGCHLVEGAGHWVQQEQPAAVIDLLAKFLS